MHKKSQWNKCPINVTFIPKVSRTAQSSYQQEYQRQSNQPNPLIWRSNDLLRHLGLTLSHLVLKLRLITALALFCLASVGEQSTREPHRLIILPVKRLGAMSRRASHAPTAW